ncbi:MAG: hypothetical protein IJS96_09030, partial [Schwartzia sp.]|nr:hypothetical protein [Schwartzia sp. (in: firmicutes)]
MAGGSVAGAQETVVEADYAGDIYGDHDANGWGNYDGNSPNDNSVTINAGVTVTKRLDGLSCMVAGAGETSKNHSGNTVTVYGTVEGDVAGVAFQAGGEHADHNTVVIGNGGKVTGDVYGGKKAGAPGGYTSDNEVRITGGTVGGTVYGSSGNGDAKDNVVRIAGNSTVNQVIGGNAYSGDYVATGNKVYVEDSTVTWGITGGNALNGSATGNLISLKNATVGSDVYGGDRTNPDATSDILTGNVLNLAGANTVGGTVENFATIKLSDDLTWNAAKPVLTAEKFENYGTLDITAATALANQTAPGTMTLLSSDTANDFNGLKLAYDDATLANPATLNAANASLAVYTGDVAATTASGGVTLTYMPVHTVSINRDGAGTYKTVTYTAGGNATKLAFGNVEWKDSGALIDHTTKWAEVSFNGAAVDTSSINFTNIQSLNANQQMTLVSSFGSTVGTITGTTYKIGSTLQGKGRASLSGTNLIYTVETGTTQPASGGDDGGSSWEPDPQPANPGNNSGGSTNNASGTNTGKNNNANGTNANKNNNATSANANKNSNAGSGKNANGNTANTSGNKNTSGNNGGNLLSGGNANANNANGSGSSGSKPALEVQPQTHNTVMSAEVSMAALSAGNDFVGAATEGLALASNVGADGVSSYANMGGGSMRQETGSHVDAHTWNAIIALGHQNKKN